MPMTQISTPQERRARLFSLAAFLLLLFFVSQHVNIYLWNTLHKTAFLVAYPILAACFLYFNRRSLTLESKLLLAFWLWFFLSRIMNGWEVFKREFDIIIDYGVFFFLGSVGLILNARQRQKALKWVGGFACGYYTLLAVISIVCSLLRLTIINPITEKNICQMGVQGFARLSLLDVNPNVTAAWFFASIATLAYFFLRCRKKWWRVPIVIAALLNYFALTLTYCRNMKVGFSVSVAMLVILLALKYLPVKKLWQKTALVILAAAIVMPLTYKSFAVPEYILSKTSDIIRTVQAAQADEADPAGTLTSERGNAAPVQLSAAQPEGTGAAKAVNMASEQFTDPRDFGTGLLTLSNRTEIYRGAFVTIQREPERLLRGCPSSEIMSVALTVMEKPNVHFHNFLLQTLIYTGLVGFLLALGYCVLLVIRMVRYFFSADEGAEFPEKLLTLPLAALLLYNMLEPMLFNYTDFSVLYFFFLAGIFLGYSHDLHPPKQRAK